MLSPAGGRRGPNRTSYYSNPLLVSQDPLGARVGATLPAHGQPVSSLLHQVNYLLDFFVLSCGLRVEQFGQSSPD